MSHRDNFIKTNKEFSKPMDIFNTGFVGTVGGSAPDIPSAPNVSVEANTVTISWSHPDAHGNAIDVYNIYRNGVYLKQVTGSTTTDWDSTGTLGTSYVYAVDAHNVIGWSGVSANSSAVIPTTAPSTPSAPSVSRSTSTITVSWSAPSANGTAITSYALTINGSSSNVGNVTSYAHTNGTLGTAYVYTISAINATGTSSASANSSSVTPSTVPSAPTIGTTTDDSSNSTVTANWSAATANGNAVTAYKVYANGSLVATLGNVTTYVYTGTRDATYYFAVSASNTNGYGATSGNSNTVTNEAPFSAIRGVFAGGNSSSNDNVMDYITIASTGNATDFGNLSDGRGYLAGLSSETRGVFGGGSSSNVIDYITMASTGNATDFGNLSVTRNCRAGVDSSAGRGVFGSGDGDFTKMDYITIASTGNATDFGNLTVARAFPGGVSSDVRGVFAGGATGANIKLNTMDYITIASTGNATDFGDLTAVRSDPPGSVNSVTRGIFGAISGWSSINYITIATTGNATNFGSLTQTRYALAGLSSNTRGVFGGGGWGGLRNEMDYVTIATTGNAADFGDLSVARSRLTGT
jgi:hypothetical protein|tara:strand:- start:1857 stop:3596 length:1740 start_codon:yes stop_codon:yes gene_type:complete